MARFTNVRPASASEIVELVESLPPAPKTSPDNPRVHAEQHGLAEDASSFTRRLDRSLLSGIAWTGIAKWMTQIISWVATLVIARLLSPSDYGVATMALVYIGLVQLVNEFGLGAAIVQRRDLDDDQIAKLGGVSLLLGAFFCALSIALASLVATFFGRPEVGPVIVALSTVFLTSSLQVLPRALLTRDLQFRRLAALDGCEALVSVAVTLLLAVLGFRYWALVVGSITSRTAGTVLALVWRRHRLSWPTRFKTIAAPVAFGSHIVVASIAWYVFRHADLTIIGRRLGTAALGSYSIGWTLASIPVDRLSVLVARATPAIFAVVQRDKQALRRYVLALTEGVALVSFPVAIGLALVARELVLVVLGDPWRGAIAPLRILAFASVFRCMIPLLNQVLLATGESKRNMQATIGIALVLPPLFYLGSHWGAAGVALVWLTAYPVISSAFFVRYAFRACDMTLARYLAAIWPGASGSFAIVVVVLAVEALAPKTWPLALVLVIKCVLGAAAYIGIVTYLHGDRLRSFLAVIRGNSRAGGVPDGHGLPEASAQMST